MLHLPFDAASAAVKENVEPSPSVGLDPQAAAVHLDDALGDGEAEPGAALLLGGRGVGLLELLENLGLIGSAMPGPVSRTASV